MKNLKGSQTEKNLYKTFAGECRARTKYNLFAEEARKEEQHWIADVFDETAGNEYAHAREVYKTFLGNVGSIEENLLTAAMGETDEYKEIYKQYEEVARDEGYNEIADFFKELREVEESHKERFTMLNKKLEEGSLYSSENNEKWICLNCGYIYEGNEVPKMCPLCKYPQGYFKLICEC
ncbi:rubrerythrin family protein [Clostridium sp. B9]|uniref:rubrerythrin family protein n=1 Tax=Clostridium sp. B9 TaxID=3423224 RepID=UPI003D2F373A